LTGEGPQGPHRSQPGIRRAFGKAFNPKSRFVNSVLPSQRPRRRSDVDHGKGEAMGMEDTAEEALDDADTPSQSAEVNEEEPATGEAAYNQAWAEEHGLQLIGGTNRTIKLLQTRRRYAVFTGRY
jgi:hypothetical protein